MGVVRGDFWSARDFCVETSWAGYFPHLNALQDIFFHSFITTFLSYSRARILLASFFLNSFMPNALFLPTSACRDFLFKIPAPPPPH